ncbi:adenosine receptor A3-like [Mercenaria mercenaria]|uniref:adenosine receptor A3-like n=1 Tax=Mercenaria mercenaria TaxID=6596 RepID=UPI00234E9042|nr:adenosine receptor A3-like [Mercenaria mercenaria]
MLNETNSSRDIETDTSMLQTVIYYGVNGFGISWTYLIVHIVLATVAVVGITLNSFTLWALRGKDSGLDVSIIFISNLAFSDVINGVICVYLVTYNLIHYKNYYECAFRTGVIIGMNFNSALQLLALTFDRYFKIIYPYRYVRIFKDKRAKVFCVCAWLLSTILCLLPILGLRQPPIHGLEYCSFFGVQTDTYLILMAVCFYTIFLMAAFCYYRILSVSFALTKRFRQQQTTKQLWWKPTKTVLILIVFYFVCWVPLSACIILHLSDGFPDHYTDDMKGTVLAYCSSLVFLDTIVNPVIYALKIRTVKRKLASIFCSLKPTSTGTNISVLQRNMHDTRDSELSLWRPAPYN